MDGAFDQRDGFIWMNGTLIPWTDARVHVLTHGLHYASSVFEGERAYAGAIFKLREHTERLIYSAKELGFEIPYAAGEIDAACIETLEANGLVDGYLRPVAWRGSEMMGVSAQNNRINLAIAAWEWPSYFDPEERLKGIRLDMADYRRPSPETAPCHAKAAGLYMICTLSKHAAESKGYADALMLDWRGRVAEAGGDAEPAAWLAHEQQQPPCGEDRHSGRHPAHARAAPRRRGGRCGVRRRAGRRAG